jgi:hypothetical protein
MPDQSMLLEGQGEKGQYICCIRSADGNSAMIYMPYGRQIKLQTRFMKSAQVLAWWFNPKNGESKKIGVMKRLDQMDFIPPSLGFMNDWVLVLDNPVNKFPPPGSK